MTAVLSRLSMGLRAIQLGMQQQQHTAQEAAKAAVQCLPTLANLPEFAAAAPSQSPPVRDRGVSASQQQQEEAPFPGAAADAADGAASSSAGRFRGASLAGAESTEEAALLVDRRLWGALPGSLVHLGFALRAALERLTHDSFVSLCIHSFQLALPSPCELLSLPAVPTTNRLLPVTALRPTLTSEAFYFVCCLAAAPLSPCLAVDLILTVKGLRKPAQPLGQQAQQQQRWAGNTPVTMGGVGSCILPNRIGVPQSELQLPYNNVASPSAAAAAAAAAPATAAATEGLAAAGMQQEAALGSIKVAAPLLRLELLRRPRIPDGAAPSAQEVADSISPRILVSPSGTPEPDGLPVAGTAGSTRRSTQQANQQQSQQSQCVLEVLLKDLEVAFISEKSPLDILVQHQRFPGFLGGRPGLGSGTHLGKAAAEAEGTAGASADLRQPAESLIEPFRMVASLRDCVIRGEDGSRLLQNASSIPKIFSGTFATGGQLAPWVPTPQSQYAGAAGPQQATPGSATPTGAQGTGQGGQPTARRHQQNARLSVHQASLSDMLLQDPLFQSLIWVSDGIIFASGEVAYLRIQLRALKAATVYSWGTSVFGALQQLKHFHLQFPAISFGCCFSTASWLPPVGVSTQQLLRVSQLQWQGPSPAVPEERRHEQLEQAVRRSLLLQQRGLGILCLLYPSLPAPALSPNDWQGYLPLQLPEMAPSLSIHRVLQAFEAEAAAREGAAAAKATAETATGPPPWRLQTAYLFQHHSDLQDNIRQQQVSQYGLRFALPLSLLHDFFCPSAHELAFPSAPLLEFSSVSLCFHLPAS